MSSRDAQYLKIIATVIAAALVLNVVIGILNSPLGVPAHAAEQMEVTGTVRVVIAGVEGGTNLPVSLQDGTGWRIDSANTPRGRALVIMDGARP